MPSAVRREVSHRLNRGEEEKAEQAAAEYAGIFPVAISTWRSRPLVADQRRIIL